MPPGTDGRDRTPAEQTAGEAGEGGPTGGMGAPADDAAPDDMGAPGPDTERSGGSGGQD
jgi:hypothetical protein